MPVKTLKDKLVVITGAASGIGRAAALAFAKRGSHIVASDLNGQGLESLAREVAAVGVRFQPFVVDVTDAEAMKTFAANSKSQAGVADVLVNNAGIGYMGLFLKSDLAHWRRVLDINLMGVVHGCYFFLPDMIAAGGPRHVLNVSSSAGNFPVPSMAAYAASKSAVHGFSEVLRMELSETGIGVTTVCPGVINTPIITVRNNISPAVSEAQIASVQAFYVAKGGSAEAVAEDMVSAALDGRDYLLTGPTAKMVYYLNRLSPNMVRSKMVKLVRRSIRP
jgi:short-subunit dehydrogenase